MTISATPAPAAADKSQVISNGKDFVGLLVIAAQLALMFVVLTRFEIEAGSGIARLLPLIFGGFLIHAVLPMRFRIQFFVLLSFAAIVMVLGPKPAAALTGVGLVLIGVCHLPIRFLLRVLAIFLLAAALAALRANVIVLPPGLIAAIGISNLPRLVIPVLGSMFMFRIIIYMYDLRHEERLVASGKPLRGTAAPASVWDRIAYFFLLPNVCFLLFPIFDYRTYRRTYYDKDALVIYQKGVWWICLGSMQLLAYRLVYHYLIPSPEDVQGLAGIVRFMTASYLVYLRVVGQFQLITGLLCLFGFNLPPAHVFYLLASSFTDFWRRARIDWKDFMVKVFYYPPLVPLQRRWGPTVGLAVATVVVFVSTWVLHAYQWFWIRGDFRLSNSDGVFWLIIGGCVLVNSLLEARGPRARASAAWDVRSATIRALKTVGMFCFMCILWSYWSSPSFKLWLSYLTALEASGVGAYMILVASLAALTGLVVAGRYIESRAGAGKKTGRTPPPVSAPQMSWVRPIAVAATAGALLLFQAPSLRPRLNESVGRLVTNIGTNRLNALDQDRSDRGYYEVLLDEPRSTASMITAEDTAATSSKPGQQHSEDEDP